VAERRDTPALGRGGKFRLDMAGSGGMHRLSSLASKHAVSQQSLVL
jgi:hypothetical protein